MSVTTREGQTLDAAVCVLAVPVNTIGDIEVTPPLSEGKRRVVVEGILGRGVKVWVRLRGEVPHLLAVGGHGLPLTALMSDSHVDGSTLAIGFGPSARDLDVHDLPAVREAVRRLVPDLEVEACGGHDWVRDPFSRTTWGVFRPGQLSSSLAELQRPEGRLHFAGGDVATTGAGYIDGALGSGIGAARAALAHLGSS